MAFPLQCPSSPDVRAAHQESHRHLPIARGILHDSWEDWILAGWIAGRRAGKRNQVKVAQKNRNHLFLLKQALFREICYLIFGGEGFIVEKDAIVVGIRNPKLDFHLPLESWGGIDPMSYMLLKNVGDRLDPGPKDILTAFYGINGRLPTQKISLEISEASTGWETTMTGKLVGRW